MHTSGINGEGELRGQPANPGSHEKMAVKTVCVYPHSDCAMILHVVYFI